MRSFVKIKPSRNGKITLSFIDIGITCLSREFFTSLICLLMLFAEIKFSRKFPNLQYVSQENARLYANEYPLAAVTILNSTFMDDSVDSVKNNEQAIEFHSHKYRDGSP